MTEEQTKYVKRKYDNLSRKYDKKLEKKEEKFLGEWRKNLLNGLSGKILEIGIGTGRNLEYYSKDADVTGIDFSYEMLAKAKEKQKMLNRQFKLIQMDAQDLRFEDKTFDYAICTLFLCSAPDPVSVIKEMKRVCKKNGKILMIEHMLSKNKIIASIEHLISPINYWIHGCKLNRDTAENIKKAGLKIDKEINLRYFDVFRRIEITNN